MFSIKCPERVRASLSLSLPLSLAVSRFLSFFIRIEQLVPTLS